MAADVRCDFCDRLATVRDASRPSPLGRAFGTVYCGWYVCDTEVEKQAAHERLMREGRI